MKTRIIAHHQQVVRIDRETTETVKVSTLHRLSEFLRKKVELFRRGRFVGLREGFIDQDIDWCDDPWSEGEKEVCAG